MIDAYVAGHCINRIGVDLKYRIMRTKDLLFIFINKDKLGIHDNQLEEFTEKTSFKYVDDNIKYYLENSSEIKAYKTF